LFLPPSAKRERDNKKQSERDDEEENSERDKGASPFALSHEVLRFIVPPEDYSTLPR